MLWTWRSILLHFSFTSKLVDLDELHSGLFVCFQVYEDEPVLQAFKVMRKKRVGGVPVIERETKKAVGNISLRDVQFLLTAPEIYHDYRYVITLNLTEWACLDCIAHIFFVLFYLSVSFLAYSLDIHTKTEVLQ